MTRLLWFLPLLIVLSSICVQAEESTITNGAKLLDSCLMAVSLFDQVRDLKDMNPTHSFAAGLCVGIVESSMETAVITDTSKGSFTMFCLPHGGNNNEWVRVVVKFIQQNPTYLHEPAPYVVIQALRSTYPCNK